MLIECGHDPRETIDAERHQRIAGEPTTASTRFLGGSPLAVAFRLILLSILVGVVLAAIGFDPWNILRSIRAVVSADLGPRLRRRQLAVALLPARRRDRDSDLAPDADVRRAARAIELR